MTVKHSFVEDNAINCKENINNLSSEDLDINIQDEYGYTPLMYAVNRDSDFIVEDLLKRGADPNIQNHSSNSPLMHAVNYNNIKNVIHLLKYSADPNVQDDHGLTPLMRALCYNHIEIVKDLLKYGAKIENLKTNDGRTTVKCATVNRNYEVAKLVINEAIKRRNKNDDMNKLIKSIPAYVNKKTFMKCKNALNMNVIKYICDF